MDYTQTPDSAVHSGTNKRMHVDDVQVPTFWSAKDANSLIWALANLCEKADVPLAQFDADNPDSYDKVYQAVSGIAANKDAALQNNINSLGQSMQSAKETIEAKLASMTQTELNHINSLTSSINLIYQTKTTHFNANQPLPSTDIGPIWHDLYNSWMTWQVFNQNGANYAGYASVDIGQVFASSQPTSRQGYVGFGMNISKSAHPAIYHRAKHLGQLKAPAQWQPKTIEYRENANGTITVPDLRGVHERYWDSGAGINSGRGFGSYEGDNVKKHAHILFGVAEESNYGVTLGKGAKLTNVKKIHIQPGYPFVSTDLWGNTENTVKNTALYGEIKL